MKRKRKIDPIERALHLRKTVKKEDRILVVDFSDTLQGKDTSRVIDLMPNIANGAYVFRTKVNVKEIDPLAAEKYAKPFVNLSLMSEKEIENFLKRREFDFPLWFKHHQGFSMRKVLDYNPPFVLQVGGCNFHDGTEMGGCWYCFVDDKSNDGCITKGKSFLGSSETIDSMISARKKINEFYKKACGIDLNIKVLRVSGGEPTIALDWVLDLWRKISESRLDFVGQIDTNLSTGSLVDRFEKEGIYEKNILEKLAEHPVKVLTALKGTDAKNLCSNVQSKTTMKEQVYSLKRFLKAGFDIFPQLYNPNPKTLRRFLSDLDSQVENLSLRVHIGPLSLYSPTKNRLELEAQRQGINAESFIKNKKEEWDNNYKQSCDVINDYLNKRYGQGYKDLVRADIKLKILKK